MNDGANLAATDTLHFGLQYQMNAVWDVTKLS